MLELAAENIIACGGESHEDFWFATEHPDGDGVMRRLWIFKADQEDFSTVFKVYEINLHRMKYFPDVCLLGTDNQYREEVSYGDVFTRSFSISDVDVPSYNDEDVIRLMTSENVSDWICGLLTVANAHGPESLCEDPVVVADENYPLSLFNELQAIASKKAEAL